MGIPTRVRERMIAGLKRLTPIVQQQIDRDVSEADTVTVVKDLLAGVFGYDKYTELTSEHAIRGTYCDLAVKLNEKLSMLIEIKSAGTALDDRHVKQVVDYASNQGIEWIILTNSSVWRMYEVIFAQPIDKRLLLEVDLTCASVKRDDLLEALYPITKEGFIKGAQVEMRDRQDATSKYLLSALILNNDRVVDSIRRELRRVVDVLVDDEAILKVLRNEVVKRDIQEGPEAEAAIKLANRKETRSMRAVKVECPPEAKAVEAVPEVTAT